ncbi:hypothetical protein PsYK624_130900 [Phanerochaete sordida]|uniref:Uncharacterized protein n=1 Tax=Phanerochaete sordida TaxID=48140 RepID=A0A9P3LK46_9APHY|nr:hypothetical protein PsYK624_130900 [Phanerochaete sordida]
MSSRHPLAVSACVSTTTEVQGSMDSSPGRVTADALVLDFICDLWTGYNGDGLFHAGHLLAWSTVSRTWAARLRPLSFASVVLESRARGESFLALLEQSTARGTALGAHVQRVVFVDALLGDAWFPAVLLAARPHLRGCRPDGLGLAVGRPSQRKPKPTSLFASLPADSRDALAQFGHISMSRCCVPDFDDFVAFCGAVCDFGFLNCTSLSCVEWPCAEDDVRPLQLTSADRPIPQEVHVQRTAIRWPFIWLFLTTAQPAAPRTGRHARYIDVGELGKLEDLAHCVLQSCGDKCQSHVLELDDGTDERTTTLRMRCDFPRSSPTVEVSLSPATGFVTNVTLLFDHRMESEQRPLLITDLEPEPVHFSWEIFDECASAFGESSMGLSVRLRTDLEHMRLFAQKLKSHLPCMTETGKLRLFYAEPREGFSWEDDMIRDLWLFEWKQFTL